MPPFAERSDSSNVEELSDRVNVIVAVSPWLSEPLELVMLIVGGVVSEAFWAAARVSSSAKLLLEFTPCVSLISPGIEWPS